MRIEKAGIFLCAWSVMAGVGIWGLSPLQRSLESVIFVLLGVLGGPLCGVYQAFLADRITSALPLLMLSFLLCAVFIGFYLKSKKLLSFSFMCVTWFLCGMIFSVGIYI